ncbi:hypothetical protein PR003_g32851 [Phytophthora rubi]|uniref:Secreted protein n=1 Tax=Phytophthora rubi TaxID=129364 RepID=A0A6A4AYQ3_9STRA|nr:hypothetical protein PR003_g32851 [Phytophthora rubi]
MRATWSPSLRCAVVSLAPPASAVSPVPSVGATRSAARCFASRRRPIAASSVAAAGARDSASATTLVLPGRY